MFLWEYETKEKVWEGGGYLGSVGDLLQCPPGRCRRPPLRHPLRERGSRLFIFDPGHHRFSPHCLEWPGKALDLGLQAGPDGLLYGVTDICIYRLDPSSLPLEEVLRDDEEGFRTAGPIVGDEILCGRYHRLMAVKIS